MMDNIIDYNLIVLSFFDGLDNYNLYIIRIFEMVKLFSKGWSLN